MKSKQKKQSTKQSKKKQILSVFHKTNQFLQIFTEKQLDQLEDRLHIFVFSRGQCLAKEKQYIDYVGVIAEGRAVSKGIAYEVGDVIGYSQILGYENQNQQNINADSDGVIVALRIVDFLLMEKEYLKNRIFDKLSEINVSKLVKRENIRSTFEQFETVEDKKLTKLITAQWASFFQQLDIKQKNKFISFFPFLKIKQKEMIANSTLKPSIIYVVQGQLISKNKSQQQIIQAGSTLNNQGFIFNQSINENVYCLSSEAIVLIVDKKILNQNFRLQTVKGLNKLLVGQIKNKYRKQATTSNDGQGKQQVKWSMFKKYPNAEILPLPIIKKNDHLKASKASNAQSQTANLTAFQTLFRDQLGITDSKQKTAISMAQSGIQKLYTMKTESAGKDIQATLELQKLRKQVQLLTDKFKISQQISKTNKLQLIQYRSQVNMMLVLKQIQKKYNGQTIHANGINQNDSLNGENAVTLKQAMDKQSKDNKIQTIVARCAFRWLYITRRRKGVRKQ